MSFYFVVFLWRANTPHLGIFFGF